MFAVVGFLRCDSCGRGFVNPRADRPPIDKGQALQCETLAAAKRDGWKLRKKDVHWCPDCVSGKKPIKLMAGPMV